MTSRFKSYYRLAKPGIVYGNVLVAAAGFIFASSTGVDWLLLLYTLLGLSLIIGSACVFNNYYDRDIDAKMERTASRPLPSGLISGRAALFFGAAIGIIGAAMLFFLTTFTAFAVAVLGWCVYVFAYTPLKHKSGHALWVGAIAGATPPVVGYAAVTNALDSTALALFIFLFIWQIPHFLGIGAYRYDDYASAGVPLLIQKPGPKGRKIGRYVFYASLVVLLLWCGALMLHK